VRRDHLEHPLLSVAPSRSREATVAQARLSRCRHRRGCGLVSVGVTVRVGRSGCLCRCVQPNARQRQTKAKIDCQWWIRNSGLTRFGRRSGALRHRPSGCGASHV
jgi:hypothetical protein